MTESSSEPVPDGPAPAPPSASLSDRDRPEVSPRETLDYLRTILSELSVIARRQRLDMLGYLIEMAYVEASDALARGGQPGRSKRSRRKDDA
ncbi:MAG: hypothetical protein M9939_24660 [Mesorhizobium sp.]|nr:hypothetical protein [Mesorhizobium sp.]MCO5164284.1 hypothetical protein [Mesorhizobium sp.]